MAEPEEQKRSAPDPADHEPPAGAQITATWSAGAGALQYTAEAKWIVLRRRERPVAEIFSVSYLAGPAGGDEPRPVSFIFNGGPGASSAYLHMGAAGPVRVQFPADGSLPAPPPRLIANEDSWLAFTDLVFVDPVGTGFSRAIPARDARAQRAGRTEHSAARPGHDDNEEEDRPEREFFGYKRDLESLCELISRWLTEHGRWGSPVFIAGESYGGYRVGRLARMLQETTGIALSGALLLSPALELGPLAPTDYDVLGWVDLLPTMALAAAHYGRSRAFAPDAQRDQIAAAAEAFATGEYATMLIRGASMPAAERARTLTRLSELIGLSEETVRRAGGRVRIETFARELLRDERRVLGLYDVTLTAVDPFPDREPFSGPDPTLAGISPAFTTAINRQLRCEIGVQTEREYVLLSEEVNEAWRNDAPEHFFLPPVGATDDLRYAMSLSPHMRVLISHGRHDLVTPYHSAQRLRNLMRLDEHAAERLSVRHFDGGHMFYTREHSRRELSRTLASFFAAALAHG